MCACAQRRWGWPAEGRRLWERTDEPVFLDEEKEKRLEEALEVDVRQVGSCAARWLAPPTRSSPRRAEFGAGLILGARRPIARTMRQVSRRLPRGPPRRRCWRRTGCWRPCRCALACRYAFPYAVVCVFDCARARLLVGSLRRASASCGGCTASTATRRRRRSQRRCTRRGACDVEPLTRGGVAVTQRRKRELGGGGGGGGSPPALSPPQANPLLLGLTPSQYVAPSSLSCTLSPTTL